MTDICEVNYHRRKLLRIENCHKSSVALRGKNRLWHDKCKCSTFIQTGWFKLKHATRTKLWLLYGICFVVLSLLATRKLNSSTAIPLNINTTHKWSGKSFIWASPGAWYLVQGIFLCIINLSPNRLHFLTHIFHLLNR